MMRQGESHTRDNALEDFISRGREIMFPSIIRGSNSSAPVIIKAKIFGREVGRVPLDSERSCEVIYVNCFMKLNPSIKAFKMDSRVPLIGVSIEKSWSSREIPLEIMKGDAPLKMGIVVSTIYGAIKFHTAKGIGTVFSTHKSDKIKEGMRKVKETPLASTKGVLSCTKAEEKVVINDRYPEQTITIENTTACKEVEELTKVGISWKIKHHTWVANPFMVKKSDEGWRMYVDFMDINKACPKDYYPLPKIDWKVESLSGFRLKCYLDAYKGYHQIQMAEGDEDKTTFFVGEWVFCYRNIPFGLKNAGATYQRLVDKSFHDQIERNLEAYIDDMVIKSTSEKDMLADIKETFERF
ncbi:reverse transcriptase domain-containing protein [Tanacetum coccineum]